MKHERIGLDIDGTLSSHDKVLELMAEFYEKPIINIEDVVDYNISSIYGISEVDSLEFWENIEHIVCADSAFAEKRTRRIYEEFVKDDSEIYLITSRNEKYRDVTEKWLKNHGISYKTLIMTGGVSKVDLIEQHKIDIMVDDKAELFYEVNKRGLDTTMVCIEYGYNIGAPCDILMNRNGEIIDDWS